MVVGATRWAPRNYFNQTKGGREQASVEKVGVAVGDRPLHFTWPELELGATERERLANLLEDVSFLGTTRSPVVAELSSDEPTDPGPVWTAVEGEEAQGAATASVRVPDTTTLAAFDRRHEGRRSSRPGLESATAAVPGIRVGREVDYVHSSALDRSTRAIDPRWWGDMYVLALDRDRSEVVPRAAASYLLARAVRTALLSAYGPAGSADEAPEILRGRGGEAHCAIVPLLDVWHPASQGSTQGVAVLLPSVQRTVDLPRQRAEVERGLAHLVGDTDTGPQRYVQIPDSGRIWLELPSSDRAARKTLRKRTYRATATSWVSVTPVVHARWRKGARETLLDQVALDCAHVGLPAPARVEAIRGAALPGAAGRPVPRGRVPEAWRKSLDGPIGHLRLVFASPVAGPLLLGRARHFGLGLFVPESAAPMEARPRRGPDIA
jgi:CRISPR-associated protein Csb2